MSVEKKLYLYTRGNDPELDRQYELSKKFAKVRLGESVLFWRTALRRYAIPLSQVQRIYRGIQTMVGRLCAGGHNFDIEYLILILQDGSQLQIHIGDEVKEKAEALLEELKKTHPEIQYGKET